MRLGANLETPADMSEAERPSYWFLDGTVKPLGSVNKLPSGAEVVVIGGGVMGVAVTYWLARLGASVVLLESSQPGRGASGRNAGLMLCGGSPLEDPNRIRDVLDEEGIDAEFAESGHLALASSVEIVQRIRREVEERSSAASPLYFLDRKQCEDLIRLRVSDHFLGGRWYPNGRTIHPARFVYGLASAAARRGAVLAFNTRALRLASGHVHDDRIHIVTSRGQIRAQHVVVACNTNTGSLLPQLHQVLEPVRGQVLCTSPLPRLFNVGLAVDWGTVYWRQVSDGSIVLGGYHNLDATQEKTAREGLNPKIQSALVRFLPEAFPGFPKFAIQKQWSGIMDETTDGRPIVGQWIDGRNIWVIAGFGGHGLPPALGVGKALAESVLCGQTSAALSALDPGRFKDRLRECMLLEKYVRPSRQLAKEAK